MYWNAIPGALVVLGSLVLPCIPIPIALNYFLIGNVFRRDMATEYYRMAYLRDWTLTRNPYKLKYLENIPDEEVAKKVHVTEEGGGEETKQCQPKPKKKRRKKVPPPESPQ